MRKPNKIWQLIDIFASVWSQEYGGEVYIRTGKDLRFAKDFLEANEGEYTPDIVISEAKYFVKIGGIFASRRHRFCDFINNIGTFAPAKKEQIRQRSQYYTCPRCKASMPESKQYQHDGGECPMFVPASQETIREAYNAINNLTQQFSTKGK